MTTFIILAGSIVIAGVYFIVRAILCVIWGNNLLDQIYVYNIHCIERGQLDKIFSYDSVIDPVRWVFFMPFEWSPHSLISADALAVLLTQEDLKK